MSCTALRVAGLLWAGIAVAQPVEDPTPTPIATPALKPRPVSPTRKAMPPKSGQAPLTLPTVFSVAEMTSFATTTWQLAIGFGKKEYQLEPSAAAAELEPAIK
jgi:hypothetical protein